MKINIEKVKVYDIELTEQELLEIFINNDRYGISMYKIADKALSEVNWHENMPKTLKLEYIAMLNKHIDAFMKNIDKD